MSQMTFRRMASRPSLMHGIATCAIILSVLGWLDVVAQDKAKSDAVGRPQGHPAIAKERLRYAGRSFEQWRELLQVDLEAATRQKALDALAVFADHGYGQDAVGAIVLGLRDKDAEVVDAAVEALGKTGAPAVGELRKLLKHPAARVRRLAALWLGSMSPAAKPALPALLAATDDADWDVRVMVGLALAKIGASNERSDQQITDALRRMLAIRPADEKTHLYRHQLVTSLGRQGVKGELAEPVLLEAIRDAFPITRLAAVGALGRIRPASEQAVEP